MSKYSSSTAAAIELLQGREALDFEVKAARGGLPNSIWPTISAFANSAGGWLLLGIEEHDDILVVRGVDNPQQLMQQLSDQLRNPQRISAPPCGMTDVSVEHVDDRPIVVVRVPTAPRRVRPIYVNGNPYEGTYVRRQSGDYRCTRPEVDRMMREASELSADQVILDGFTVNDLSSETVSRYRRRFQNANPESPHNELSTEDFLATLGARRFERESGRTGISVAGLLLFGTEVAIHDWRPRHLFDFRLIDGLPSESGIHHWNDRVLHEGNLLDAYDALSRPLLRDLPVPLEFKDGVRVTDSPAHRAVREALVNALVHADYRESAATLFLRFTSGFVFRNPGSSRVADLDSLLGDRSDPRNPFVLRAFRRIGLAEEAGSGIPRIRQSLRALGYEPPEFDVGIDGYEFSVSLRLESLLAPGDLDWLSSLDPGLSEAMKLALVTARHEGSIDNARLRELTGLHPGDVTHVLGNLRDAGLLQMFGAGRGARYELDPSIPRSASLAQSTALSPSSTALSPSSTAPANSPEDYNAPISTATMEGVPSLFSPERWVELEALAVPVASRDYVASVERERIIMALCAIQPLSLLELTWLLNRKKPYVRRILGQMVRAGHLHYLYPDRPQHPQQRYIASKR